MWLCKTFPGARGSHVFEGAVTFKASHCQERKASSAGLSELTGWRWRHIFRLRRQVLPRTFYTRSRWDGAASDSH